MMQKLFKNPKKQCSKVCFCFKIIKLKLIQKIEKNQKKDFTSAETGELKGSSKALKSSTHHSQENQKP